MKAVRESLPLTRRMLDCARVIAELTKLEGRPPSIAEIGAELDARASNVKRLLDCLAERGWIARRPPNKPRSTVLLKQPPPPEEFPVALTALGLTVACSADPAKTLAEIAAERISLAATSVIFVDNAP